MAAPSPDGIALIFFHSGGDGFSAAAARVQRRFRLIGCKMVDNKLSSRPCVATAWDVSNEKGTALDSKLLEALKVLVGSEKGPLPASVRGSSPAGTIVAGPIVNAVLAKELQLVPGEEPTPLPSRGRTGGGAAPSGASSAAVPELLAPRTVSLTIGRSAGGVKLGIARLQPRVSVALAKPSKPGGSWLTIQTRPGAGGAAGNPADKTGKQKPAGKDKPVGKEKPAGDAPAKPAPTDGTKAPSGAAVAAPSTTAEIRTADTDSGAPLFRSTAENTAVYMAMRHSLNGDASQAYMFHHGQPAWRAKGGLS